MEVASSSSIQNSTPTPFQQPYHFTSLPIDPVYTLKGENAANSKIEKQFDEDMEEVKNMATLVRLKEIISGPYQDEECLDFMDIINKKCSYKHYKFIRNLGKTIDYIRVVVISKGGKSTKELIVNTLNKFNHISDTLLTTL